MDMNFPQCNRLERTDCFSLLKWTLKLTSKDYVGLLAFLEFMATKS